MRNTGLGLLDTRDFDQMFERLFAPDAPSSVAFNRLEVPTDVFQTDEGLVIRMDLPGVSPEDVEVTVQKDTLLVNGVRRFPYEADKVRFVRRGTFYGDFTQRVRLASGLNADKVNARFSGGVLEITVPFAEEVQPRKISIQVGEQKKALT